MMYDDDALERALEALPLEEPPAGLHARIMAATVYAPAPASPAALSWELWLIALLASLALWLGWVFAVTPNVVDRLTSTIDGVAGLDSLTSASTLLWVALGVSAAWWITGFSLPHARETELR